LALQLFGTKRQYSQAVAAFDFTIRRQDARRAATRDPVCAGLAPNRCCEFIAACRVLSAKKCHHAIGTSATGLCQRLRHRLLRRHRSRGII
jgi:hypothetical protein